MKERPVVLQHDDFHCNGLYNGMIDFNRFDWGDTWHDFYKFPCLQEK
ncbi:aminoglycoside phosphotransferase (APT) family kinase protein [Evansella vedderi]|uniref:Aminoglycoside phosphotransferase (APT) family kinase protein n=2 Tax=Evansella vedderi TaxID=38282 RepID=A0ABU0A1H3_9BACI|nr:aminoglycoside phosphotransferase (APT) family kinase protein [Evansella vedderi]